MLKKTFYVALLATTALVVVSLSILPTPSIDPKATIQTEPSENRNSETRNNLSSSILLRFSIKSIMLSY